MHVLLIEDHRRLSGLIRIGLEQARFTVDSYGSGQDGLEALANGCFDAVVLDLGLPDIDGMELLRRVRDSRNAVPVLILTSRIGVSDRIKGLNAGADDYLTKPFDMDELIARLHALLRRPETLLGKTLQQGNLTFDTATREARVNGLRVDLTPRESSLIETLIRRGNKVVPKLQLETNLYGTSVTLSSNTLEVLVHRLRKKLGAAGSEVNIRTVRGVGYILTADAS